MMATSGRGSGVVGYNVQTAVDTENHLIVAHEVTNVGSDRSQLANTAQAAKEALKVETLEAVADRGYFNVEEIKACEAAGVTVTLPKPMTSGAKAKGRFGKQDFVYLAEADVYRCPAGEQLSYRMTTRGKRPEDAPVLDKCVPSLSAQGEMYERPAAADHPLGARAGVEAVQERLDKNPGAMRTRRETVEHPFGTLKMRMGATHFLCKTLPKVATEMALCVLGYNMTRVLNILGAKPLLAAIAA